VKNNDRSIWILGASRGIGAAIARSLQGYRIAVSARSRAALEDVASVAEGMNTVFVQPCDVASVESTSKAYESIVATLGPTNILVYCAGIGRFAPVDSLTTEDFDRHFAVNTRGYFDCIRHVLPWMKANETGQIIYINSIAVLESFTGCSVYGASKAAARAISRSVRAEVRGNGIKVTDVFVGATDTDIWDSATRESRRADMMTAEDVAMSVNSIISEHQNTRTHVEELVLRPQRGDL